MVKLLSVLWLLIFVSSSEAQVLGKFQNDSEGFTYLLQSKEDCGRFNRVEAWSSDKKLLHVGCFALHNSSLVLMWFQGPATVVRITEVDWDENL